MKHCGACKTDKPTSKFWKDSSRPSGFNSRCIDCEKLRAKGMQARMKHALRVKASKELHKHKHIARLATRKAVLNGTLKKEPCFLCASKKKIEGHHINYNYPLKIIWLCRKHHSDVEHSKRPF